MGLYLPNYSQNVILGHGCPAKTINTTTEEL